MLQLQTVSEGSGDRERMLVYPGIPGVHTSEAKKVRVVVSEKPPGPCCLLKAE